MIALHEESLARFGGRAGIRDEGLPETALERPRNLFHCEDETNIATLAAGYGFGLARNNPFVDGNKRAAVLAIALFCSVNGLRFAPPQTDEIRTIIALAAGDLTEVQFANWIAENSTQRRAAYSILRRASKPRRTASSSLLSNVPFDMQTIGVTF